MGEIVELARGDERRAFAIALVLGFANQAMASTSIINYAPKVLSDLGAEENATLMSAAIGLTKAVGVLASLVLVDSAGRRPLLIWGSYACAAAMVMMTVAVEAEDVFFTLLAMCGFMLAFSTAWAGVYWVLVSEFFSTRYKSPAASAATAALFLAGAFTDLVFLSITSAFGSLTFLLFAFVAFAAGTLTAVIVPETKGRQLGEIQALLRDSKAQLSLPRVPAALGRLCGRAHRYEQFDSAETAGGGVDGGP